MTSAFNYLLEQNLSIKNNINAALAKLGNYSGYKLRRFNKRSGVYYQITKTGPSSHEQVYFGKMDKAVQRVISYKYLEESLRQVENNIYYLSLAAENVTNTDPDYFLQNIPATYRDIPPYIFKVFNTISIDEWKDRERRISNKYPENKIFSSKNGEMMSSKSEVAFANTYLERGIPYFYEMIHKINGIEIAPDFTILDPYTKQEYIHEHFGRLDNADYYKSFSWKINNYIQAGYIPGVNLLFSYETKSAPLTQNYIDSFIDHHFTMLTSQR